MPRAHLFRWFLILPTLSLAAVLVRAAAPAGAEAMLVIAADQHSAYERSAQFVAHVDRLRMENPKLKHENIAGVLSQLQARIVNVRDSL